MHIIILHYKFCNSVYYNFLLQSQEMKGIWYDLKLDFLDVIPY